jgi:2'-5' RNA ligase
MENVRAFLAVDPGEKFRVRVAELQQRLRGAIPGVRWVDPGNIHLTLKFLGDVGTDTLGKLDERLRESLAGFARFTLQFSGAGAFPETGRPRVLWVGALSEGDRVQSLAVKVSDVVSRLAIPTDDKPFRPHLTIGRFKQAGPNRKNLESRLEAIRGDYGQALVDRVILFKSTLTPRGPIYSVLSEVPLRRGDLG